MVFCRVWSRVGAVKKKRMLSVVLLVLVFQANTETEVNSRWFGWYVFGGPPGKYLQKQGVQGSLGLMGSIFFFLGGGWVNVG